MFTEVTKVILRVSGYPHTDLPIISNISTLHFSKQKIPTLLHYYKVKFKLQIDLIRFSINILFLLQDPIQGTTLHLVLSFFLVYRLLYYLHFFQTAYTTSRVLIRVLVLPHLKLSHVWVEWPSPVPKESWSVLQDHTHYILLYSLILFSVCKSGSN